MRIVVIDSDVLIDIENIVSTSREILRKVIKTFLISFCGANYILIPKTVSKEVGERIIQNLHYYSNDFVGFEICEISNQREIENLVNRFFKVVKASKEHRGEADAINQILKIGKMDNKTKIKRYGSNRIELIFVSGDKGALNVAENLGIEFINWKVIKPYLMEISR
ncbi:MAG: hypothetical protein ABIL16_02680 [candidate division WOR-3 bacterium]